MQNHPFFMLNVNQHISEVEWALRTAYLKTNNTIDTWQNRSQCKRFTNLFLGDLAKNLFKTFIINQSHNSSKLNNNLKSFIYIVLFNSQKLT
jgi:5-methylthioribose kinase